ncbi:MAG: hypothetical protein KC931_21230, partial [Candidatus Omnitrophica bacterium]|nr:hypothetical protein [Candidatus Omnitrophota bacterium]
MLFRFFPCLILLFTVASEGAVTFHSLLSEMTRLDALSQYPDPSYKTIQFSSTDRRSTAPYASEWYANSDGFGSEPIPNVLRVLKEPGEDKIGRYVIAEATGPGAIVRTWTARINGRVSLYLDDSREPVIEGEMTDFLMDTYGMLALDMGILKEKRLEKGFHQRNASYFPIPFAKNLRVEWEGNLQEIHFYEIEILKY